MRHLLIFTFAFFLVFSTLPTVNAQETPSDNAATATEAAPSEVEVIVEDEAQVVIEMQEQAAQAVSQDLKIVDIFQTGFGKLVDSIAAVLFYELFPISVPNCTVTADEDCRVGFPLLVIWLVMGGAFFTLRLAFVNLRLFGHGFKVALGRFAKKDDPGEVTPFASLSAAVSGTVGLGNIAGVAVAIAVGGPGAVVWMMVAGFLGMSTKFAEVTMGHKYREIDENGRVSGGAFYYLSKGLAELKMASLGKALAVIFAVLCLFGSLGGGNMFQSNQMVAAMTSNFTIFSGLDWVIALVMAVAVGIVLIGGVKRIAQVAEAIVPTMAIIYLLGCLTVLAMHLPQLPEAVGIMFDSAFNFEAGLGGIIGALVQGFRRAAFSNEAGVGSAPIVMSATKSREPVQIGSVAILEPFIDTLVICFMTGMVIVVTGAYLDADTAVGGVELTSSAFASVIAWFPKVLSISVALFAFSTMITWSYYGERAWNFLFGSKSISVYHIIFCSAVFFGGAMQDDQNEGFALIIGFSDLALLSMAVPNLIGLYLLSGVISRELKAYRARLKAGEIQPNK